MFSGVILFLILLWLLWDAWNVRQRLRRREEDE